MNLDTLLNTLMIVVSIAIVGTILLQQQGSGLGTMFGGAGGESYRSKRGVEKLLFNLTIFLVVIFVAIGLAIAIASVNG